MPRLVIQHELPLNAVRMVVHKALPLLGVKLRTIKMPDNLHWCIVAALGTVDFEFVTIQTELKKPKRELQLFWRANKTVDSSQFEEIIENFVARLKADLT